MLEQNIDLYFSGFFSLTILTILIVFLWITMQKMLNVKKKEFMSFKLRELESIESVREQISNDLHDAGSSILTQLKLKIKYLERHLDEPINLKNSLTEIKQNLNEFSTILNHTIEEVFPKELILGHWTQAVEESAMRYQSSDLNILFHSEISINEPLEANKANQCFRIVQELMTNIVKYEHPKKLFVEIYKNEMEIVVVLEANECRFNEENEDHVSGGRGNIHFVGRLKLLGAKLIKEKNTAKSKSLYTLKFKENECTNS